MYDVKRRMVGRAIVVRVAACGLMVVVSVGCGTRQSVVELPAGAVATSAPGDVRVPQGDDLKTFMAKVRQLSEKARPLLRSTVATVEATDRRLGAALVAMVARPKPATFRLVANEYRRLGIFDHAHDYLKKALAFDAKDAATHDTLARLWRDWGMPHLGLGYAYRAVYFAPSSAAAHNTLGTVLQALAQDDAARARYEVALRYDPTAAYALNNLCYSWVLEARGRKAVAACLAALLLRPDFVAAQNNLGLAFAVSGQVEAAAAAFDKAGDVASARYNEGIVLLATRHYAEALAAFEAAHRARPDLRLAAVRVRQARSLLQPGDAR